MDKTKLDIENPHHQLLISVMARFVDDYGYTTRELFSLMDHSKNQLFHGLAEIERENKAKANK